jgi:hypothetical protein
VWQDPHYLRTTISYFLAGKGTGKPQSRWMCPRVLHPSDPAPHFKKDPGFFAFPETTEEYINLPGCPKLYNIGNADRDPSEAHSCAALVFAALLFERQDAVPYLRGEQARRATADLASLAVQLCRLSGSIVPLPMVILVTIAAHSCFLFVLPAQATRTCRTFCWTVAATCGSLISCSPSPGDRALASLDVIMAFLFASCRNHVLRDICKMWACIMFVGENGTYSCELTSPLAATEIANDKQFGQVCFTMIVGFVVASSSKLPSTVLGCAHFQGDCSCQRPEAALAGSSTGPHQSASYLHLQGQT